MRLSHRSINDHSLLAFLYDRCHQTLRNVGCWIYWGQRYKIIKGIARDLQYLHEDSQLKVVHRDLKASNILLDAKMRPKISD